MRLRNYLIPGFILALSIGLSSCYHTEDPGPLQYAEQPFSAVDFNRLEIGNAMFITVRQGSVYSVSAKGDRRNIDDLLVDRVGNTLVVRFSEDENRRHTISINITMPELRSAVFPEQLPVPSLDSILTKRFL